LEILYYRDPAGNFGDDLNGVVWRELLPAHVFDIEDVVLMGIGSILNAHCAPLSHTRGKRMFVLGSGAGYGPLPADWENWNLLGVRGPLTAKLLGRPELAITDSAALLSLLPSLVNPGARRDQTLLVPHYNSAARGQWQQVAAEAGMTFVDPRWPVKVVMEHFSHGRLVITEAMHGAIVADAMRIPWIPISIAPNALPFKWWDWTLSLDMAYEPVHIPASSVRESLYHSRLVRTAKTQGLVPPALVRDTQSTTFLISDFHKRYGTVSSEPKQPHVQAAKSRQILSFVRSVCSTLDRFFVDNAAKCLRDINLDRACLSREDTFLRKVDQLQAATARFIKSLNPRLA
jgi:succinoglycan biosynthesis protein ExoV